MGPINEEESLELENYDTIIRFNDVSSLTTINHFRFKSNITYLNSKTLHQLIIGEDGFYVNDSAEVFFVIKSYISGSTKYLKNKFHRVSYSNPYFINGSPNMLQMAVWDLLHFEPKEIHVFGVDFFLSKNIYPPNYIKISSSLKRSFQGFINSMAIHNLISNRRFMISLSVAGLIQFDEIAKKILSMSDEEYLGLIFQQKHSNLDEFNNERLGRF